MVKASFADTIAAISTPLGEGGLGVIRISGAQALSIGDQVFRPRKKVDDSYLSQAASHTIHYGHIVGTNGEVIDEVLVSVLRAPRTYTREDTVEISCHGGIVSLRRVLQTILAAGARLAEPGEFTKRAFLNGRIDLAQAEAVIDIIRAKTEKSQRIALQTLQGDLSKKIDFLREQLMKILMYLEAAIDFPEDEIPPLDTDLGQTLVQVETGLEQLIDSAKTGRIYREGLALVIAGKPNVGKSSLLNAFLDEERAIVTGIPGTTRDVLEEYINLQGLPLKIIDTAGIRSTTEEVELLGVERSKKAIQEADLILFVVDTSAEVSTEDWDVAKQLPTEKTLLVANKVDKTSRGDLSGLVERFGQPIYLSAYQRIGLNELVEAIITKAALVDVTAGDEALVTNMRHVDALRRAKESVEIAKESHESGMAADFVTIDLRDAVTTLGEITGDTASDDLIERIFASFCIGK